MADSGILLESDGGLARFRPFPVQYRVFDRNDVYAFNRAGRDAEVAAGTFLFYYGMHLFGGPQYRIDGAGLDAECAADAHLLINGDDGFFRVFTMFCVQWFCIHAKQVSQRLYGNFAAGRTLVDVRFSGSHCLCVWPAARVGALPALCLWQQRIDLVNNRITFYTKTDRCITEYQANQYGQSSQCKYRG